MDMFGQAVNQAKQGDMTLMNQVKDLYEFNNKDMTRFVNGEYTEQDVAKVAMLSAARQNLMNPFAVDTGNMHPTIKLALAFTRVVQMMAGVGYYALNRARDHGDWKPLARLFGIGAPLAFVNDAARDAVLGRDDNDPMSWKAMYAIAGTAAFGLGGEAARSTMMLTGAGAPASQALGGALFSIVAPPSVTWLGSIIATGYNNPAEMYNKVPAAGALGHLLTEAMEDGEIAADFSDFYGKQFHNRYGRNFSTQYGNIPGI